MESTQSEENFCRIQWFQKETLSSGIFFVEDKPGVLVQYKEFRVKRYFIPPVEDKDINSFCWKLRDEIDNYIELSFNPSQNL